MIPIIDITGIPEGHYCYEPIGWDGEIYRTKTCPHWVWVSDGVAKCMKFDIDDSRDGTLIWDQVKECGYNMGDD